ncbi:MAG: histidine kinase, partial [Rhodothermales bacterium]
GGEITGIFRDVSAQRRLEQQVLAATDEERTRVGYQLHEGLGQMLTGIGLITRSLHQKLRAELHPAADEAQQIIDFLREADKYAKELSQGLIPVDGDATGLSYALQRLAAHTSERYEVACTFRQETGGAGVEDHAVAAHLYQIAQEAVTMLARYSHARNLQVILSGSASHARVSIRYDDVEDNADADGHGTESTGETDQAALEKWQKILSYRARVIGAILRTRRGQRGGSIKCTIPLYIFADEGESS